MKVKATDKFSELDSSSSYQGLGRENFRKLKGGLEIELDSIPKELKVYLKEVKGGK